MNASRISIAGENFAVHFDETRLKDNLQQRSESHLGRPLNADEGDILDNLSVTFDPKTHRDCLIDNAHLRYGPAIAAVAGLVPVASGKNANFVPHPTTQLVFFNSPFIGKMLTGEINQQRRKREQQMPDTQVMLSNEMHRLWYHEGGHFILTLDQELSSRELRNNLLFVALNVTVPTTMGVVYANMAADLLPVTLKPAAAVLGLSVIALSSSLGLTAHERFTYVGEQFARAQELLAVGKDDLFQVERL
jgi:hypothetical protein